ncbi:MAG: bifunctional glutamate N-acetyltransferase/amino-acid acetyltransferase ArgJ [Pseudomonadota bacterium]
MAKIERISPLAPAGGFPDLPIIKGVRFASCAAGVKYQGRDDVMLALAGENAVIAGTFTRSATRSAPVLDCEAKLGLATAPGPVAILVNSGNANAFTGSRGSGSVARVCAAVAEATAVPEARVFTGSTGVIGEPLPDDRIRAQLVALNEDLSLDGIEAAAWATMTTDTYPKGAGRVVELPSGGQVSIAGFAKGSGMIAPDMATMLVHIFTDARIVQKDLQAIVSKGCDDSFNAITVDSDTSTSDTLLVVASGEGPAIDGDDLAVFADAMDQVMLELAHLVVRDGEGATKFVEINVEGAVSDVSAKIVALAIANSPLVKTAIAGEDPNWGRVVMAIGKAGEPADRDKISIWFGDILVAEEGWVSPDYREDDGAAYMKADELVLRVGLGMGDGVARVWTCDLTHDYISINADYRS